MIGTRGRWTILIRASSLGALCWISPCNYFALLSTLRFNRQARAFKAVQWLGSQGATAQWAGHDAQVNSNSALIELVREFGFVSQKPDG